ncbi:MAG: PhoH-related ATPase [Acidobacteria bacterium]|nr:PhoH-related ATPase [Acidobacteriota bacterium]
MQPGDGPEARVYLPDTNVLVNDPDSLFKLGRGNVVVIPYPVVRELDHLKDALNGTGAAARRVVHLLDDYQSGREPGRLVEGIPLPDSGLLIFDDNVLSEIDAWDGFDHRSNDDRIILLARKWKRLRPVARVSVVTRDVAMRVKARPLGVLAEDYRDDKKISSLDQLYSGAATIEIPEESHSLLTDLHREARVEAARILELGSLDTPLLPNQCCTIRTRETGKVAHAIYKVGGAPYFRVVRKPESDRGITPVNAEQSFAHALLSDPDISLVTLAGSAGSGKTLMALLAAYQQLREGYSRLIIYRPNIEIGQSLGFLPGTLDEKFAPWTRPVIDNLELILRGLTRGGGIVSLEEVGRAGGKGRKEEPARAVADLQELVARQIIEIAPISYLRGRSIHDAFIVADEAQNMNHHEVKTLLTRSGQGTKVVFTGDPDQVDVPDSSAVTNGLIQLVERFKGQEEFGHLTMTTTVRSRLAALAASLL